MTTTSSTGAISSVGIGSGLDVTAIISGLMKIEQAPLNDLTNRATAIQTTISTFGAVQSSLSAFRDAAAALALPSAWNVTTGTSSDATAVGVSTSANATPGNYAVEVTKLAASQSTVSGTFASSAALVGAGTLHIDLGSWNTGQTAFTAKAGSAGTDISVSATDTLDTLASKINSASPGIGASVVNDATGSRLVFSASTSGAANSFRVTAVNTGGATGLSALAFDPPGGATPTTQTQAAGDASATINGLTVTSPTNTLSNVLNGLTLNLTKVTTSAVQIGVAQDQAGITKAVQGFVDTYNSLSTLLSTDLKYDSGTKIAGPLQGDAAARTLQNQLRHILGASSGASSAFTTLSQVGLQLQTDGTLKVDSAKLTSAMANSVELKKLFTRVDLTTPANDGFANQLRTFGDQSLGISGVLTSHVSGLNTKLQRNQTDQGKLNERLSKVQARLQAQYTALDRTMASSNALGTYVTQQITNWNKNTA